MVANQVSREIEMDLRSVLLSHSTLEFGIPSLCALLWDKRGLPRFQFSCFLNKLFFNIYIVRMTHVLGSLEFL